MSVLTLQGRKNCHFLSRACEEVLARKTNCSLWSDPKTGLCSQTEDCAGQDHGDFPVIRPCNWVHASHFSLDFPFVVLDWGLSPHVTSPPGGKGTPLPLLTTDSQNLPALFREKAVRENLLSARGRPCPGCCRTESPAHEALVLGHLPGPCDPSPGCPQCSSCAVCKLGSTPVGEL